MRRTLLNSLATVAVAAACADPPSAPNEYWAADLPARQVLAMWMTVHEDAVSGTGTLTSVLNVGGDEPLTVRGWRRGDSLGVTYTRDARPPFTFEGRYASPGLTGVLHGAEFDSLHIAFRNR